MLYLVIPTELFHGVRQTFPIHLDEIMFRADSEEEAVKNCGWNYGPVHVVALSDSVPVYEVETKTEVTVKKVSDATNSS